MREATPQDRQAVTALWRAAGLVVDCNPPEAGSGRALGEPWSTVLVGEIGGGSAASRMTGDDGRRRWVCCVSVDRLRLRGRRKAELMARKSNAGANGFYQALDRAEEPAPAFSQWGRPKHPDPIE